MNSVVAIDLGTSRSAWAFSTQGGAEDRVSLRVPLGSEPSFSSHKTDTAVLLNSEDHAVVAFGSNSHARYLAEIEDMDDPQGIDVAPRPSFTLSDTTENLPIGKSMLFRWFKMELSRQGGFQTVDDPVAISEGGHTLPLLVVMTAVLRFFKEDVLAFLSCDDDDFEYSVQDVIWVVTIPAIYDDFARRFMRVAAHKAGLIDTVSSPRLRLCLEPEAACLAVGIRDESSEKFQPGTRIMILDCGGGTVDITTHEVLSRNPLRLAEVCAPSGGPWGSTCVDTAFVDWCENFLGSETFTRVRRSSAFLELLVQWEGQKTKFGGAENETVLLNMSGFVQIEEGKPLFDAAKMEELRTIYNNVYQEMEGFTVSGNNFIVILPCRLVTSLFAPTINKISDCLNGLKQKLSLIGLKYVFMVGGFSASPLVRDAARSSLEGEDCRVIVAHRPEVAIARGAVLFANNAEVFSIRKARLTYGVKTCVPFNCNDPEHCTRENTATVEKSESMAVRVYRFSRHLECGDDIPLGGACPKLCYRPGVPTQSEITVEILASHQRGVRFADEETTFPLGKVTVPLDMNESFPHRAVDVQFIFSGTEISVNCFRAATGEEVGAATFQLHQET